MDTQKGMLVNDEELMQYLTNIVSQSSLDGPTIAKLANDIIKMCGGMCKVEYDCDNIFLIKE